MSEKPVNYVDYDFETLLAQLQSRLALKSAWKDMYRSATGSMLIELFSAVGTLILYYIERRAEESYIGTAKNRSSLINLARLVGFTPQRRVSATGTLRVSLPSPATSMTFINSFLSDNPFICSTTNGTKYMVLIDKAIDVNQTYVDVTGVQGTLVDSDYTSTGIVNQEYNLKDTTIENTYIYVYVNNVLWTKVDSFIDSTNTSAHYTLRNELDDTVTIVFGDNVFGKSPSVGDVVTVKYLQSSGLSSNVYTTGSITTVDSTVYDATGTVLTVTVSNTTTFLGGDDAMSDEEIRTDAPKVFATGDRLVTKEDFKVVINAYPSVGDSNAWGENEETPPNYNMYNQVKLCVILQNWVLPDAAFEETLSDYLYDKSLMTVRYSYVDPVILYIVPTLYIRVTKGASISYVQSEIETVISDMFDLGTTAKLGTATREGDVTAAIEAIDGVAYSHLTLKIQKSLQQGFSSTYTWAEICDAVPLLPTGVEIYIDSTQIAVDDGSNGFTATASGYTVTGNVNYTTGAIGVNITPAPGAGTTTSVRYQQDQLGDIVPTKNQISKWLQNVYTTISYES